MTVLLLLFLVRAFRSHPWGVRLRTLRMRGTLALLMSTVATGCAPWYEPLAVLPADPKLFDGTAQAPGVYRVAEALEGCDGVQRRSTEVEFACMDGQEIRVRRYEAGPDGCRHLMRKTAGPALDAPLPLGLPPASVALSGQGVEGSLQAGVAAACVPQRGGEVLVVAMVGAPLDSALVSRVLPALAYAPIPDSLVVTGQPDSLAFFGRALPVHASCRLVGARNLSCYPNGQMDWAEYSTHERAEVIVEQRIQALRLHGKVSEEEDVACTFEGVATTCRRVVVEPRLNLFQRGLAWVFSAGQSLRLVVYLVAEEVRGRHAVAACSLYDDQMLSNGLTWLCMEAFSLRDAEALELGHVARPK